MTHAPVGVTAELAVVSMCTPEQVGLAGVDARKALSGVCNLKR